MQAPEDIPSTKEGEGASSKMGASEQQSSQDAPKDDKDKCSTKDVISVATVIQVVPQTTEAKPPPLVPHPGKDPPSKYPVKDTATVVTSAITNPISSSLPSISSPKTTVPIPSIVSSVSRQPPPITTNVVPIATSFVQRLPQTPLHLPPPPLTGGIRPPVPPSFTGSAPPRLESIITTGVPPPSTVVPVSQYVMSSAPPPVGAASVPVTVDARRHSFTPITHPPPQPPPQGMMIPGQIPSGAHMAMMSVAPAAMMTPPPPLPQQPSQMMVRPPLHMPPPSDYQPDDNGECILSGDFISNSSGAGRGRKMPNVLRISKWVNPIPPDPDEGK